MIAFIVVACLMVLAALAFVIVPLLRTRTAMDATGSSRLSDDSSNVAVFRSQKREIEEDFARGVINATERDAALGELSQRLVDEVPDLAPAASSAAGPPTSAIPGRPWWLAGALGVLIPAAAFTAYAFLGSPQALREGTTGGAGATSPHAAAGATGADAPMSDKQIVAMVDTLAQKMQQNPGDPKGWVLLARSQAALGRYPEAMAAYERAAKLLPGDAQLLADHADVVVMTQQGRFEGKPMTLIEQALKLDPNNLKALALAGTAELRKGNHAASLRQWEKLKSLVAKDSDDYRQVEAIIAEVKSGMPAGGVTAAAPGPAPVPAPAVAKPAPGPTPAGNSGASVAGQVLISPDLAAKLAPTDTLFVFARAKEGPRMPLAALRVPGPKAGDFPKAFELTDAMAMSPGLSISSFSEVVIEARVSRSGNAQLQSGDLLGISEAVKPGSRAVKVTISKVAP